ncbi:MAG TPA: FAD-dependent oxidoreductase [Spirochaetota bacterium]|nr:FAD-dependent oxidoreductase [Spirochaetota bacterium]
MRIVIIGAVAGGTSAAAKARRNSEEHEIVIYDIDSDISYSGCGIPYFIGEDYITRDDLTPRDPSWFKKRFNIDIFTRHFVTEIYPAEKNIEVKNLVTGESFRDSYDKLIIATGAVPVIPVIPGINNENVFPVRTIRNAGSIKKFVEEKNPRKALIIGGGFIGLEMAENLSLQGMDITLVESAPHLMPAMDADMAVYIEEHLGKNGVTILTGDSVKEIFDGGGKALTGKGSVIETDMIIVAAGVRPNTGLIEGKGIRTGSNGGIIVNDRMETSLPDIFAVGDCCEVKSFVTGEYIYRPLGSTANKMGRIAGDVITGGDLKFRGVQGTGIFKTFGLSVAHTGISEKEASDRGLDILVSHNIKENRSKYLKESSEIVIKCIADKKSERILGVQIIGEDGVDKRIDVFVTAMSFGAKVSDLFHLDLAYAPPFSTTKDPVIYSGMILHNAMERGRMLVTPSELIAQRESFTVIDVRSRDDYEKGHIDGAINIPHEELKAKSVELDKTKKYAVHCNKGTTGNAAQNLLLNLGFREVYNISGGYNQYKMELKLK